MDYDLPTPAIYHSRDGTPCLFWRVDGFFNTNNSRAFFQDIKTRLCDTLQATILSYPPDSLHAVQNIAKLSEFRGLNSIKNNGWRKHLDTLSLLEKSDNRSKEEKIISDDRLFDVMRFSAYDYVKAHGKEALTVEYIESVGVQSKDDFNKSYSDARGKAKAIYVWVMENYTISGQYSNMTKEQKAQHVKQWRDLQKLKKGEDIMSRTDNAKKQAEAIAKDTEAKVRGAIASLQFLQEKITAVAVAKQAGVSRPTATKYLKEMGLK